jgi:hypothetical protein
MLAIICSAMKLLTSILRELEEYADMLNEYWSLEDDEEEVEKFIHRYPITEPDECPICQRGIQPKYLFSCVGTVDPGEVQQIRAVFQCPKKVCQELFIGYYMNRLGTPFFIFFKCAPVSVKIQKFSEEINSLSPSFHVIYNQALEAEGLGLNEICGMGYHKALEFLVKDFAIKNKPTEEDQIKAKPLVPCIKEYIDDLRIKDLAERAAWLGNDESHYVRKWEDKDVGHLKQLIELIRLKIEQELLYEYFKMDMPAGKK